MGQTSQRGEPEGLLSQPEKWVQEEGDERSFAQKGEAKDSPCCGLGGRIIELSSPKGKDAKQILSRWPKRERFSLPQMGGQYILSRIKLLRISLPSHLWSSGVIRL